MNINKVFYCIVLYCTLFLSNYECPTMRPGRYSLPTEGFNPTIIVAIAIVG